MQAIPSLKQLGVLRHALQQMPCIEEKELFTFREVASFPPFTVGYSIHIPNRASFLKPRRQQRERKKSHSPCSQPRAKQPHLPMIFCICFSLLSSPRMLPLCSSPSEEPPAESADINLRSNSDRGGKSSVNPNRAETIWQKEANLLRDHFVLPATSAQAVRGVSTGAAFLYSTAHSAQFSLGFFSLQYCFVYCTKAGGLLLK